MIENSQKWEDMGKAGRDHVMKNFSEEVYMQKIISKLEALVQ
jgi:glycosyltransferase involved in cell wall biosynthesis